MIKLTAQGNSISYEELSFSQGKFTPKIILSIDISLFAPIPTTITFLLFSMYSCCNAFKEPNRFIQRFQFSLLEK